MRCHTVLGNAKLTKKMGPVAGGNLYEHSIWARAQHNVYSEGTNNGFTWSALRAEMLPVGYLSCTSILLYSLISICPHVTRTPLLLCNEWEQEKGCSTAQIIFPQIPSTSTF